MVMDITTAQACIQAECDRLTTEIQAKGYPKGFAEIWIGRGGKGGCTIYIPSEVPCGWIGSAALPDMIADAHAKIEAMPHKDAESLAYAAELSAPLWLMSEHMAEAAE